MTVTEIVEFYGSKRNFARQTGMSINSLFNWQRWGFIPLPSQAKIEQLTNGKLKLSMKDALHD